MNYKPTQATLEIVKALGGIWKDNGAMCRCPAHGDRTASLSIKQGRTATLVTCFAGCTRQNVLAAIRTVMGGSLKNQLAEPLPERTKSDHHKRIWKEAKPIHGTLAERYLREVRGITFIPKDCRFHPRCPRGKAPLTQYLPALLVGVFLRNELIAVQRIFLDAGTARYTTKMILGDSRGGSWPSSFSTPSIAIAEGFETACAHQQLEGVETGTCFGTRNHDIFEPPADTTEIVYLPDNDEVGRTAARKAVRSRISQGYRASIKPCPASYGDWADITRPPERH